MMGSARILLLAFAPAASILLDGCVYVPGPYPGPYYGRPIPGYHRRYPAPPGRYPYRFDDEGLPPSPGTNSRPDDALTPDPGAPGSISPRDPSDPGPNAPPKEGADHSTGSVPTAERVPNRAGRVKSPYPPYRELDVSGLPSGSLAKDPVSGRIFRIP